VQLIRIVQKTIPTFVLLNDRPEAVGKAHHGDRSHLEEPSVWELWVGKSSHWIETTEMPMRGEKVAQHGKQL
jgi:hypothetical protein